MTTTATDTSTDTATDTSTAATADTSARFALRLRYFAAAGEAAGTHEERVEVPAAATLGDLRSLLSERHGAELTRVLRVSALLVDGRSDLPEETPLVRALGAAPDPTIDVLPPFAGG